MTRSGSNLRSQFLLMAALTAASAAMCVLQPAVPSPQSSPQDTEPASGENIDVPQREWYRNWTMESRVTKAQLIMVARVKNISAVNVIQGAKANMNLREYRFEPVSVLKGVFTRDELTMTDSDLGLPKPDLFSAAPFQRGEHILLILTRTRGSGIFGCVSLPKGSNEPRQLIPRLAGSNDPIVSMTQTMINVSQTSSQQQRVVLSRERLTDTTGPAAVPLLLSLGNRGYWVQSVEAARILTELTASKSPAVRNSAASTITKVLASGAPIDDEARKLFADALQRLLQSTEIETNLRTAALTGLGHLSEFGRRTDWVSQLLVDHLHTAKTHAERGAAASALAELGHPKNSAELLKAVANVPLDERRERELLFVDAAVRLAKKDAAPVLLNRLKQKLNSGHAAAREILHLGQLRYKNAVPALLQAALDGKHRDETSLANAFRALGDERAVPVLSEWLASTDKNVRSAAILALDSLNSKAAAAAMQVRLKSETDLALKLRMAEALGRHGLDDGYAIAMEHLADPGMTPFAAKALAAINDDRTSEQLLQSLDTSHDTPWNSAALQGLAALKDSRVGDRLVTILSDRRSPLLSAAISSANTLSDPALIPAVTPYLLSRNYQISASSIATIKHLAAEARGKEIHTKHVQQAGAALIEVLNDPDIHIKLRIAALDALQSLRDSRLPQALRTLADHSRLENTELLKMIRKALSAS